MTYKHRCKMSKKTAQRVYNRLHRRTLISCRAKYQERFAEACSILGKPCSIFRQKPTWTGDSVLSNLEKMLHGED